VILYTRNPIATAADWQSAVCPLSSSDSRAQLLINFICYTYYYTVLLRIGPRGNDDIIYFTLSPLRHSQFFFTRPYYIYTQVPPSCLSDRKHRRGRRPRGLYYYYIVYKRSSSYISPISISYRNRTPCATLIIVMYNINPRTFHIMYSVIRSYNCRGDPRCRPAAIFSN